MADEVIWDKEIDIPEKWIQFVDENVLAGITTIRNKHETLPQ